VALRREKPGRSVRVLIRAARRAKSAGAEALTKSNVVRLLRAHGLSPALAGGLRGAVLRGLQFGRLGEARE